MALFVLAFAICLSAFSRGEISRRAGGVTLALLAAASLFTFSLPGLAWFALALPIVAGAGGARRQAAGRPAARRRGDRPPPARRRRGRRRPAGDRRRRDRAGDRLRRADQRGAGVGGPPRLADLPRRGARDLARGRLPAGPRGRGGGDPGDAARHWSRWALGVWALVRGRDTALLATLAAAAVVYVGARLVAEIHVEAKALAVMAPLVTLIALRALLVPSHAGEDRRLALGRHVLGGVFALGARGVDLPRAARRAGRLRPARRGPRAPRRANRGRDGRLPRASTASAPTGCAARSCAAPAATCRPRSRRARRRCGSRARRWTSTRSAPYKLDQFDYAITTERRLPVDPAAEPGARRRGRRLRPLGANRARRPAAGCSTPRGRGPGNPGAILDCQLDRRLADRPGEATGARRCRCSRRRRAGAATSASTTRPRARRTPSSPRRPRLRSSRWRRGPGRSRFSTTARCRCEVTAGRACGSSCRPRSTACT